VTSGESVYGNSLSAFVFIACSNMSLVKILMEAQYWASTFHVIPMMASSTTRRNCSSSGGNVLLCSICIRYI